MFAPPPLSSRRISPLEKAGLPGTSTEHGARNQAYPSHQGWVRWPDRRKKVQSTDKIVRDNLTPTFRCSPIHQSNNHNIYAKDLIKTHSGSTIATSISLNLCKTHIVDSVSHATLVSLITLTPSISPFFFCEIPWAPRGGIQRDLQPWLSGGLVFVCGSLYALISCWRQHLWWRLD